MEGVSTPSTRLGGNASLAPLTPWKRKSPLPTAMPLKLAFARLCPERGIGGRLVSGDPPPFADFVGDITSQ